MSENWNVGDWIRNRWQIHRILKGGMGVVYIVYDRDWQEVFAAKTFQDQFFDHNPAAAEQFKREALGWVHLDTHPNIAQARFVETVNGKPYLFLEYVSGGDLQAWIGTPRLISDLSTVLRFGIQFCDGMAHAIEKGITAHRDIKPQNCLVTDDLTLKVTDFGLAKVGHGLVHDTLGGSSESHEHERDQGFSRTGESAGTPAYMAPEQFDDFKHVDLRADIYSFGVMLFQMVTGRLPFLASTWTEFERLHQQQPPMLAALENKEISHLIGKCLAKRPEHRWQDFSGIRKRLGAIYTSVTRLPPPTPVRGHQLDAAGSCWKAVSLSALGKHEEALTAADLSVLMDDASPSAWIAKGVALQHLRRAPEAIVCFDRALALSPANAIAWANKGLAIKERGELQMGLACQERALALQPLNEKTWSNIGSVLWALGRHDEGLEAYDRALALNPNYAIGWFNKGSALHEGGAFGKAIDCYRRAVSLNPRLDYAWFRMGVSLEELRRPEEALVCYDQTLSLVPTDTLALSNKAGVLQDLNRGDEALAYLDRALAVDRTNGTVWHNKGSLLLDLKRFREAIAAFKQAQALGMADASRGIAFCLQRLRTTDTGDSRQEGYRSWNGDNLWTH